MFVLDNIVRGNIKALVPYSSARDEYKGKEGVFLDANENAFGSPLPQDYNRYPDPLQQELKNKISELKGIPVANIFLGNGSDEAIDLLFRMFCIPGKSNVMICPPTYGMYEVSANLNDVAVKKVPLFAETFQLDDRSVLDAIDENTRLIFVCSPNNPTGNVINENSIKKLLQSFKGIVVLDEAYADFSDQSFLKELPSYPNLVILQTFSKAWGMAGLRTGLAFASEEITALYNKIKPPYNISSVSQQLLLEGLENGEKVEEWIGIIRYERERFSKAVAELPFVEKVYGSDSNFVLLKTKNAAAVYEYLSEKQIIVRDRSKMQLCENCLRITIGTPEENNSVLEQLKNY